MNGKRNEETMEKFELSSNKGSGMVGVLVLIFIMAMSVTFYQNSSLFSSKHAKRLKASQSYLEIDKLIVQSIHQAINTHITDKCLSLSKVKNVKLGTLSTLEAKKSPSLPKNVSPNIKIAHKRCTKQIVNKPQFHLCYSFNTPPNIKKSLPKTSFLSSEHAFLEITTEIKDLHNGKLKNCGDYDNGDNDSVAMYLYYSLFWSEKIDKKSKGDNKYQMKRKNGKAILDKF